MFVAVGDVNGDGHADIIVGAEAGGGPEVAVYSGVDFSLLEAFYAFPSTFEGGVRVAAVDLNGDGKADIICGAGPGALPQVTVFSGADRSVLANFYAFPLTFYGGVFVAGLPATGSQGAEVVVGAGAGGGPQLSLFNRLGTLVQSFFDPRFAGVPVVPGVLTQGERVATVVVNGETEIVVAPGTGSPAVLDSYDAGTLKLLDEFFAFDPSFQGGAFVS